MTHFFDKVMSLQNSGEEPDEGSSRSVVLRAISGSSRVPARTPTCRLVLRLGVVTEILGENYNISRVGFSELRTFRNPQKGI